MLIIVILDLLALYETYIFNINYNTYSHILDAGHGELRIMKTTQEVADSVAHPPQEGGPVPCSDIRRRPRWAKRLFGPRSRTTGSGATGDWAAFTCLCVTTHS